MENQIKSWHYIIILSMYLVSGSFFLFIQNAGLTILFTLIILILYIIRGYLKFKIKDGVGFLFFFVFYEIINYVLINNNHVSNGKETIIVCHIVFCIFSYFVITNFEFKKFRKIFLNISLFFAIIGIIAFALALFNIVNPIVIGNIKLVLYQNLGWAVENTPRLAGIFWEPGAYQIVLMIALIFYWQDIKLKQCTKSELIKLAVLCMALLATQSSWGYFCFMYYIFTIIIKSNYNKNKIFSRLFVLGISISFIYILTTSTVITAKLAQSQLKNTETSYSVRLNDNIALATMIKEKPLFGYGIATKEFEMRSWSLDNKTSSNGILQLGATLGVLMMIVYIYYLYKSSKRMFPDNHKLIFPLFILLNLMEVFYYFPLAYLLIFNFKNYKSINFTNK